MAALGLRIEIVPVTMPERNSLDDLVESLYL
jgi:hypothetical protein